MHRGWIYLSCLQPPPNNSAQPERYAMGDEEEARTRPPSHAAAHIRVQTPSRRAVVLRRAPRRLPACAGENPGRPLFFSLAYMPPLKPSARVVRAAVEVAAPEPETGSGKFIFPDMSVYGKTRRACLPRQARSPPRTVCMTADLPRRAPGRGRVVHGRRRRDEAARGGDVQVG